MTLTETCGEKQSGCQLSQKSLPLSWPPALILVSAWIPYFQRAFQVPGSEKVCVLYSKVCGWKAFYSHNLTSYVSHPLIISSHGLAPQFSCTITHFQLILKNSTKNLRAYLVIFWVWHLILSNPFWNASMCELLYSEKDMIFPQGASGGMTKRGQQWLNTNTT